MDDIPQTLRRCLRQHLPALSSGDEIDMSTSLVSLGLDSMSAISLLLDLERTFSVEFPKTMLEPATFRTGESLLVAVRQLVASRPEGS